MLKEKHKNYVLLAQGCIDHGRLTLFPIEVYDLLIRLTMFLYLSRMTQTRTMECVVSFLTPPKKPTRG